jgi:hypothetical protein
MSSRVTTRTIFRFRKKSKSSELTPLFHRVGASPPPPKREAGLTLTLRTSIECSASETGDSDSRVKFLILSQATVTLLFLIPICVLYAPRVFSVVCHGLVYRPSVWSAGLNTLDRRDGLVTSIGIRSQCKLSQRY